MQKQPVTKCPLCPTLFLKLSSVGKYTKHLCLFHASKPDFKITCSIISFKNHLYGMHGDGIDYTMMTDAAAESQMACCNGSSSTDDVQETEVMSGDHNDGVADADHDVNELENYYNYAAHVCSDSLCRPPDVLKSHLLFFTWT